MLKGSKEGRERQREGMNDSQVIQGKEGRIHDRMKVNNTEETGAKVGWKKRRRG